MVAGDDGKLGKHAATTTAEPTPSGSESNDGNPLNVDGNLE
jgi:hypothetical protein